MRVSKIRNLLLFLGIVLLFPVLFAACDTDSTPVATLQRSLERQQDVESFRADMTFNAEVQQLGESVTFDAMMEMSRDEKVRAIVQFNLPGEGEQQVEAIITEPHTFVQIPGQGWFRVDNEEVKAVIGQSLEGLRADSFEMFFPEEAFSEDVFSVEDAGDETIDGMETTKISIDVDFQKLLEVMNEEDREKFQDSLTSIGVDPDEVEEAIRNLELETLDLWIDNDDLIRQAHFRLTLPEQFTTDVQARLSDFNEDITIEEPTEFQEGFPGFE